MSKRCDENVLIRICRPTGGSDGESVEQRSELSNGMSVVQATEKDPVLGKNNTLELAQSGAEDRLALQSAKKATQKMEMAYKRLNQKYRKILSILNKCIDLQNAQIDKKSLLHIEYLPVMQKPNDKLKISGIKKAQNEEEIDKLQKQVTLLESQISGIKESHKEKMSQQDGILCKKMDEKSKLWKVYQNYCNPKVKIDHVNNHNLYWKPQPAKQDRQSQQNQQFANQTMTSFTKNVINSHKMLTKKNIETRMNIDKKTPLFQTYDQNYEKHAEKVFDKADQMKQEEIKSEIKSLFMMICKQEDYLEKLMKQEGHKLKNATVNQIKNRKNGLKVDEQLINECLKTEYDRSKYMNWMKEENTFERFQKELRQKQLAAQTFTTIRDL